MSRKHAHRADNAPASRRYVRSVVQRARDDIIAVMIHSPLATVEPDGSWGVRPPPPERLARYVGDDA
jgi:hypothetical protein